MPTPSASYRFLGVALVGLLLSGCANRIFRHSGAVNMSGTMRLDGPMDLGELKTSVQLADQARSSILRPMTVSGTEPSGSRIAIIDVDGFLVDRNVGSLVSNGENPVALFREKIDRIIDDSTIQAVVVRINSPGGGVTASDMMGHELTRLKKHRQIPIIASIMVVGTGGGYYLANHCDRIVAHPTSIVGGVGVILNTYNIEDTMGQFNILSMPIKSGEKIDAGTPERPLEEDEVEMLQRIADSFHDRFIQRVLSARPELRQTQQQWSDGSVLTGTEAESAGLIDQVGYLDAAIELAGSKAGLQSPQSVVIYRRDGDLAFSPFDIASSQPSMPSLLPFRLPGLDRSSMPTFLYMWQADPSMATLAHP